MEWIVVLIFALLMMWAGQLHTALAANADRSRFVDQELREYPVAASEHVYRGSYVGVNPAGYLKTFVPGDEFVGIAYEEADNSSGAAAAINCQVFVQGDFSLTLTSAALTDVHKPVYATDDNALSLTGHPDAYVGRIVHYITTSTAPTARGRSSCSSPGTRRSPRRARPRGPRSWGRSSSSRSSVPDSS
jgi:hypothetical protein